MQSSEQSNQVNCQTEYDVLKKVIVCPPKHMRIGTVINETQKRYVSENINVDIAMEQHRQFVDVMKKNNVDVIELETEEKLNEQVFTRDIGFTVGEQLFVSAMGSGIRTGEVGILKGRLHQDNIPFKDLVQMSIEGGDVVIDKEKVWVGLSTRTTLKATEALQALLPNHQVIPVSLERRILHLDCAFNIIGDNLALIYPNAFSSTRVDKLREHYELIEVNEEEQFTLGTNVLSIGEKKIISMPQNKQVNKEMEQAGFDVIEVEFNEIIKSGGSFRCCSMPLLRM
ncbi:dimethylarginine dimethylaminohydrolase family protein [Aquibacillus sediminis]|uniref:dimethylarginine dimethylaminohydrolase family protein n=1 Tax=Aquibacillus sediminis TaxID=2574734 RepID=UPI00110914E3|nr:dimethylarginine dimethylaminohydrolase family protein [Aquibacillus sediminis]